MKIRAPELAARLERHTEPMVLVRGDEPLLVEEAVDLVRQAARRHGFAQSQIHTADQGFSWNDLFSDFHSPSLFAPRVLHELRLVSGKVPTAGSEILRQLLQGKSATAMLLIVVVNAERSLWDTAWARAFEEQGLVVTVDRLEGPAVVEWLRRRMERVGLRASPQVADYLAARMEGNFLAMAQEVDKLHLLTGEELLTEEGLEEAVADHSRYSPYGWIDACLEGHAPVALHILGRLRGEGTEPILLLSSAARETRSLLQIAAERSRGVPLTRALVAHRIFSRRQPRFVAALSRLPMSRILALLQQCARMDRILKGRASGQLWLEFEALTVRYCG